MCGVCSRSKNINSDARSHIWNDWKQSLLKTGSGNSKISASQTTDNAGKDGQGKGLQHRPDRQEDLIHNTSSSIYGPKQHRDRTNIERQEVEFLAPPPENIGITEENKSITNMNSTKVAYNPDAEAQYIALKEKLDAMENRWEKRERSFNDSLEMATNKIQLLQKQLNSARSENNKLQNALNPLATQEKLALSNIMKRHGVRPLKLGNAELGLALGLDCLRKPLTEIRDYLADLLPADDETKFLLAKGEGSCDEYSFPTKPSNKLLSPLLENLI